jgi:SAM-dependent methyltransferase
MNVRYWLRHPVTLLRRIWHFGYERRHPEEPFLAPSAVRFLDRNLPRHGRGLEWGSGRSTRWLAPRLGTLVAVEHDQDWLNEVTQQLGQASISNVDLRYIPLDHPQEMPTKSHYDPVPAYVDFASEFSDEFFDFIEVDGHYRQACVTMALAKLKPGGLLLVDDTNWLPLSEWGVPNTWQLVHQSTKINTVTSIWRKS